MESGVLEPLCSLARSEDVEMEIQRFAILAIANLASATENHPIFIEEGMLPLLISLSTANDAEVRQVRYFLYVISYVNNIKMIKNMRFSYVNLDFASMQPSH